MSFIIGTVVAAEALDIRFVYVFRKGVEGIIKATMSVSVAFVRTKVGASADDKLTLADEEGHFVKYFFESESAANGDTALLVCGR